MEKSITTNKKRGDLNTMNYRNVLVVSLFAILTGCATAPADIAPAMVDTTPYKKMTCDGLLLAAQNEGVNLESVSKDQRAARNWDIALNILLIPGFGAITGDSEREVAEAKGRVLVIQNEYGSRCNGS
ncbi:MAG: hypothetical protein ACJA0W_002901 [Candidatus Azotimanducaceae bacterium]|jgi:hypothetical protein